jgi:hypothetical protein
MASQPTVLPSAQLQAIRLRYTQQRLELADQEQLVRAQSADLRKQIEIKWRSIHTDFSRELANTHQQKAQERAKADSQLASARKATGSAVWQRELADREVAVYRKVNYRNYVVRIVRY